ncbi:hypothetical protein Pcinc_018469 [Petrolisthes cinctipes]|uniref:Uncharacterized protein n=1 Tax=Petrolisthes cinctipes TaxID=88211 RepID=A0AAE1KMF4_PETCI|nr:hypothetical protein Pcinc_018469 [Petrolisthes cinctipes]
MLPPKFAHNTNYISANLVVLAETAHLPNRSLSTNNPATPSPAPALFIPGPYTNDPASVQLPVAHDPNPVVPGPYTGDSAPVWLAVTSDPACNPPFQYPSAPDTARQFPPANSSLRGNLLNNGISRFGCSATAAALGVDHPNLQGRIEGRGKELPTYRTHLSPHQDSREDYSIKDYHLPRVFKPAQQSAQQTTSYTAPGSSPITNPSKVQDLGVCFSSNATFSAHIATTAKKVHSQLETLKATLDHFLRMLPDEPPMPHYHSHSSTNSIVDWLAIQHSDGMFTYHEAATHRDLEA